MSSVTYSCALATYNGTSWDLTGAAQGRYSTSLRTGIIHFNGNLRGKIINSVALEVKSSGAGNPETDNKTAYFYPSAYDYINTEDTGDSHRTGDLLGRVTNKFYSNTVTIAANFLRDAIHNGANTFCLYVNENNQSGAIWSANYLKWTEVKITINYVEPPAATPPTTISPAYGTLSYYYSTPPIIQWTGAANVDYYVVEFATSNDIHLDNFSVIGTTTDSYYIDDSEYMTAFRNSLSIGGYARYRVKAVGYDGVATPYIYTGNIRRMLPQEPPSDIRAAIQKNTVIISWHLDNMPTFVSFTAQYSIDGVNFTDIGNTKNTSIVHNTNSYAGGSKLFYRVRLEQNVPNEDVVVISDFSVPIEVKISGGITLMAADGCNRGMLYKCTSKGVFPVKKAKIKTTKGWMESI